MEVTLRYKGVHMEASNSLKKKAVEEILKRSRSFQFGNVTYFLSDKLPEKNISVFFTITVNNNNYFVYVLCENTTSV